MARKVRIEEGLYGKIEKAAAAAGYPNVDEFVVHLPRRPSPESAAETTTRNG